MNKAYFEATYKQAIIQRNVFILFSFLLLVLLVIMSFFLFSKKERIIVVPPHIEKEFWVSENAVSPTYIEQFGSFIGQLLLSKNANSAANQRSVLLRHTAPNFISALRLKLIQEEEMLEKQNASYVFFPVEIRVGTEKTEALILGDRIYYVNGKQVSQEKEAYLLSFAYTGTGLYLKSVEDKSEFNHGR